MTQKEKEEVEVKRYLDMLSEKGFGHTLADQEKRVRAGIAIHREITRQSNKELKEALEKIAKWEMPKTGRYWDSNSLEPMSYAACYGSNGERDFIRNIASEALKNNP